VTITNDRPTDLTLTIDPAAVANLRTLVSGLVLVPGDAGYDEARATWNLAVDQRPALVVVADDRDDVVAAVRFAADRDLAVGVRATGHGTAQPADGGVLVVTAALTAVDVDPVARTARVGGGTRWGAVLAASHPHGLAPLLGSSSDVGVVGYTLGGGMGWLARRHGLAADRLRSVELVTADGTVVEASPTANTELFWALQGAGGGAFGIVTSMEIELVPVDVVYAGNLYYPAERAHEVLARWREWVRDVPEELTSAVSLMNFPPFEEVPAPLRGKSFAIVRGCFAGDLEAGKALVDQWRAWATPEIDHWGPMPFSEADHISNDPVDPMPFTISNEWFDELTDEAVDTIVKAAFPGGPPPLVFAEIRHAGGAIARGRGALDRGRTGAMVLTMLGVPHGPGELGTVEAHVARTRAALAPVATGASFPNFTERGERRQRSSQAFTSEALARLRAVKASVDPDGTFAFGGVDLA